LRDEPPLSRVVAPEFCEMSRCKEAARWRIGTGTLSVAFCRKHAISAMRSRRLWLSH
jgi:hypothetical protein